MKHEYLIRLVMVGLALSLIAVGGCSMMRPPAIEEDLGEATVEEPEEIEAPDATFTHEQVVEAVSRTLKEFKFTIKRTDTKKAEVETEWRREEAFEGGGPSGYGGEDVYRSFVIVSFDFNRNRVYIRRQAQFLDFYINDWRDINPRRYHHEEDMDIQKVIMQYLEEAVEAQESESSEPESSEP